MRYPHPLRHNWMTSKYVATILDGDGRAFAAIAKRVIH